MDTTSSSATTCANPTRWGICLALAPHTIAYLKVSLIVRWIWSQTSSMVEPRRTINASPKLGSSPFLFVQYLLDFSKFEPERKDKQFFLTVLCRVAWVSTPSKYARQHLARRGQAHNSWRPCKARERGHPGTQGQYYRPCCRHIDWEKMLGYACSR